jgi:prepilin-type N-terminal cleavage/methylation domain-containing protein
MQWERSNAYTAENMNNKIKAFTLMEVTVAMLLSAICISICYSAYHLIESYYHSFNEQNAQNDNFLMLKQTLQHDFSKSRLCMKAEDGIALEMDSTTIYYHFEPDFMTRKINEIHTDTFKLSITSPNYYFEHEPILAIDTIDQIDFGVISKKDGIIPIRILKHYSAQDLIP